MTRKELFARVAAATSLSKTDAAAGACSRRSRGCWLRSALAKRMARAIWAMLSKGEDYRNPVAAGVIARRASFRPGPSGV